MLLLLPLPSGRETGGKNLLDAFTEDFCAVVERHAKYIIVSGFVAISSGRPRGTEDIDMIVERLPPEKFRALHAIRTGRKSVQDSSMPSWRRRTVPSGSLRKRRKEGRP
ncbi:TPA: hypothetical protein HA281_00255 [Candidatus Woesearchaeota archaeon]|nr:hypothetical protein [Candidatus Woesearchaeota archaeon]HIH91214.1 hypothetical protein [Candidatus Woesearchaeota archaeon]HII63986.1 hypothetical protein [Candidatus Woesearchaeota archaeon]